MMHFTITADNIDTKEHRVVTSHDMAADQATEWFDLAVAAYTPEWRLHLTGHVTSLGTKEPT